MSSRRWKSKRRFGCSRWIRRTRNRSRSFATENSTLRADGGMAAPLLKRDLDQLPTSASRDGRFIEFNEAHLQNRNDIHIVPLDGSAPYPFAATPADERDASFSPDGCFLAYFSDETGRPEVYVRPYPAKQIRWRFRRTADHDRRELVQRARPNRTGAIATIARPLTFTRSGLSWTR